MAEYKQAKGMKHIRHLKRIARIMWKEYGCPPDMWIDCIEAAMKQHRLEMYRQKHGNEFPVEQQTSRTPDSWGTE